ncbi:hypothetical protein PoB_005970400 [Plakobranchus ocellatus]|uniref:Uncharacterized protein n=1 Tax=Plakobranchus ocellatus TaxID=259542 RepID=A0AAV4CK22_9GAST|nr:hypothetical protein PoB_005970400 [Plakobranchus ocellatus]
MKKERAFGADDNTKSNDGGGIKSSELPCQVYLRFLPVLGAAASKKGRELDDIDHKGGWGGGHSVGVSCKNEGREDTNVCKLVAFQVKRSPKKL